MLTVVFGNFFAYSLGVFVLTIRVLLLTVELFPYNGKVTSTVSTKFPKNHDGQRRDRILLRLLLCPEIGQLSPHFGAMSSLNYI